MKIIDLNLLNYDDIYRVSDLDRFFNVYEDADGNNVFNLNETVYLNFPKESLSVYTLKHALQWTLISHKIYGTTRLAWLLMKINNVSLADSFRAVRPGTEILYLPADRVRTVLEAIS